MKAAYAASQEEEDVERMPLVEAKVVAPPPPPPAQTAYPFPPPPGTNYAGGGLGGGGGLGDVENLEKSLRRGFVQKVFGILTMQLLVTIGIIAAFVFTPAVGEYVQSPQGTWLYWTTLVLSIVLILAMACCSNAMRKVPINYIMLFTFTVVEGVLVGVICTYFSASDVVLAFAICALIVFCLTLFACQTRIDITGWGPFLFVILLSFIFFGIFALIFPSKTLIVVYCSLGVLIFSLYLVYDIQLMLGGKHKNAISLDEYAFSALMLYLDIINIFLYLLSALGASR